MAAIWRRCVIAGSSSLPPAALARQLCSAAPGAGARKPGAGDSQPLDANLRLWERKARKEARGDDPAEAFAWRTEDVRLVWLCSLLELSKICLPLSLKPSSRLGRLV